jgi:hypothetical protein
VGGTGEFDNELALPEESHRRLAWEELRSVIAAARPAPVAVVCSAHEAAWILDDPSVERPAVVDRSGGLVVMRWE